MGNLLRHGRAGAVYCSSELVLTSGTMIRLAPQNVAHDTARRSVKSFAETFLKRKTPLYVLINNAGACFLCC